MLPSQYIPYATVALVCAVALLRFCSNIRRYAPDTTANRFFRIAILSSAVCSMMEFCFSFHESGLITNLVYCYATEICYSVASLVCGYFWVMCSEMEQDARTIRGKWQIALFSAPFALMVLTVITTPLHHLSFYFTEDGHYVRGILNTPLVVISALYIAKSGAAALIRSFQRRHYLKRVLYRTFFYYALAIVIAQLFQIVLGSVLPFRIIGAVIVFYLVQEQTLRQNIFVDLLTDTNNRTAMEKYLRNHFEGADERFTCVMIDIDYFKQINDRFGHGMGDRALSLLSRAFHLSLPPHFFFARYGGDEFVAIGKPEAPEEIDRIMEAAQNTLNRLCKEEGLSFCPVFSYGAACKTAEIRSVPDLLNRADTAMYETKRAHKALK